MSQPDTTVKNLLRDKDMKLHFDSSLITRKYPSDVMMTVTLIDLISRIPASGRGCHLLLTCRLGSDLTSLCVCVRVCVCVAITPGSIPAHGPDPPGFPSLTLGGRLRVGVGSGVENVLKMFVFLLSSII